MTRRDRLYQCLFTMISSLFVFGFPTICAIWGAPLRWAVKGVIVYEGLAFVIIIGFIGWVIATGLIVGSWACAVIDWLRRQGF